MATAEESVGLLGQVPVFETLAPDDLQRVVEVAVPRSFPGHHVIFREGDASDRATSCAPGTLVRSASIPTGA